MTDNRAIAENEFDMLRGNINRMFICDTQKEFEKMYGWAKHRLEVIYKALAEERGWQLDEEVK